MAEGKMNEVRYLSDDDKGQSLVSKLVVNLLTGVQALVIFIPLLIINFLQVASIVVKPFSPKIFRATNRFFANYYWALLVFCLSYIGRIKVSIVGDDIPEKETVLIESNHQNIADIPIMMVLAWQRKRLGDLKFFVKDVLKYIPGPGWGMLFLDCIFLKRNWLADKARIEQTFENLKKNRIPFWLVSFLEGTRMTPEKLSKSQSFMKRRGLPHTNFVMAPRTKGFIASIESLRSHISAVYSVTLFYPEGIPSLWQFMAGQVDQVVFHVKRTPIDEVPEGTQDLENWISDLYVGKDKFLTKANAFQVENPNKIWTQELYKQISGDS
ncbi:MAG: 1-acyl-sn-glycerol-3-phosphate acyltransferase [Pseudobacteriovorax sp.]|nr:1-acyl-sn-glycerol-3-phosphate acyltransferase [Pseudobacteriovorax sp.]